MAGRRRVPSTPTKPSAVKQPKRPSDSPANEAPTNAVESVAMYVGKGLGTAVKRTRPLRNGLKAVGASIVDAGSRAGELLKEALPSRKKRTVKAARSRKTATPHPVHGDDTLTHQIA